VNLFRFLSSNIGLIDRPLVERVNIDYWMTWTNYKFDDVEGLHVERNPLVGGSYLDIEDKQITDPSK
jgi:hypothetical protein